MLHNHPRSKAVHERSFDGMSASAFRIQHAQSPTHCSFGIHPQPRRPDSIGTAVPGKVFSQGVRLSKSVTKPTMIGEVSIVRSSSIPSKSLRDSRALVTGASSGIGAEFARQLAGLDCSLVLTARRKERLEALAAELRDKEGVDVEVVAMDLGVPDAPTHLKSTLFETGIEIDILVNNAGFGFQENFVERDWADWERVIDLDIKAFTQMTHVFARDMMARNTKGRILQVGSIFSFGGIPTYAVYSAAKSYVLVFSEALANELEPFGITVTTLAPGVTQTGFFDTASEGHMPEVGRKIMQTPQEVVADGIKAMLAQRPLVVSGWINKALVFSRRLLTRQSAVRAFGQASRS